MITDLRSDTFTKPSPAMLQAMFSAEVGDDVFDEDPTVKRLENKISTMFGKEAALFCPSGTMANQIAIKSHTQPGEELICEKLSHVYIYEAGGIAFNSGCQVKTIPGNNGLITAEQVKEEINQIDLHKPNTSLVCLENTSNRGGGTCYDFTDIQKIKEVCLNNNLKLHLDGARLWNAFVAKNESPEMYGEIFDSISVCLSKGLGAPVGSVLTGNRDYIQKAKKVRKVFGGGMRQAGFLAAAGIYAIDNNISKLKDDHLHAKQIAEALSKKDFIGKISKVETNILIFEILAPYSPQSFAAHLKKFDVLVLAISSTQVRMITHLDVSQEMVQRCIEIIGTM